MDQALADLIAISRQVGADTSLVQGGGQHVIQPGTQLGFTVRFLAPEPGVYTATMQLGSAFCTDLPITPEKVLAALGADSPFDAPRLTAIDRSKASQ